MSDVLRTMFHQTCVYWPPSGNVDDNGQVIFSPPYEIRCRWVDITQVFLDREGNEQVSNAKIRLASDVQELGVLWLGTLADIDPNTSDPFVNESAWEVRKFQKVPDPDGREYLRIAFL